MPHPKKNIDLIEILVILKEPTTPTKAWSIGKRLATVVKVVAKDSDAIERVFVSDVRGDESA
jgi:hypothetical protein